jgi:TonB family protein
MTFQCRRWAVGLLLLMVLGVLFPIHSAAQDASQAPRKLISKVTPDYPQLARKMQLHGVVRLDIIVAPNGSVKSVQVKGGHPVLADAAQAAVYKWKWESAPHETTTTVEVKFGDE